MVFDTIDLPQSQSESYILGRLRSKISLTILIESAESQHLNLSLTTWNLDGDKLLPNCV